MTQYEEYQGKHQRLSYLVQLLTFFITMSKTNGDLTNDFMIKKLQEKIKTLADAELGNEPVKLEVI